MKLRLVSLHGRARSHICRWRFARGMTLIEMIAMFPFIAIIMGTAFWAIRVQWQTHARLARQADRQAVMRIVLKHLREDMAAATGVALSTDAETESGATTRQAAESPDPHADLLTAALDLTTPGGLIRYRLYRSPPVPGYALSAAVPEPPPERTLIRIDARGEAKRWSLFGQRLTLVLRPQGDARQPLLDVRFDARLRFDTGTEVVRRYETTLRLGGLP